MYRSKINIDERLGTVWSINYRIQAKIKSKKENLFSRSEWERLMISREERQSMIKLNIIGKPLLCGTENTDSKNSDIKERTCTVSNNRENDNYIIIDS